MNQDALDLYQLAVHELFIRWDGLKLAVEHMGGRHGQQVIYTRFGSLLSLNQNFD